MKTNLSICILGDVCPERGFRNTFDSSDMQTLFGDVLDVVRQSDIAICNLEAPASLRGAPISKCGPTLCCKPSDIDVLSKAGITVFSLANNHILDYGEEALLDTVSYIKEHGLHSFGAGRDLEEASKPIIIERNGWRIGCISFAEHEFNLATETSAGANPFDPYHSLDDVRKLKSQCDYLIVLYHGGIENYAYPSPLLQKKCHALADAGANIVLCQHSHCIGAFETYNGTDILYGQGNTIFGRIEGDEAWNTGLLVLLNLSEETQKLSFRLIEAGKWGIRLASDAENEKRITEIYAESDKLHNDIYIKEKWNEFCKDNAKWYLPMLLCWGRVRNKLNRILNNRLVAVFTNRKKRQITMNLVRCDAHREVVQTILENAQQS